MWCGEKPPELMMMALLSFDDIREAINLGWTTKKNVAHLPRVHARTLALGRWLAREKAKLSITLPTNCSINATWRARGFRNIVNNGQKKDAESFQGSKARPDDKNDCCTAVWFHPTAPALGHCLSKKKTFPNS